MCDICFAWIRAISLVQMEDRSRALVNLRGGSSGIDLVQIDSVSGGVLPLKPFAAILCRMGGCGRRRKGGTRERGGQGVGQVGMTTDLHLHSVAVGNEASRCARTEDVGR